jgi:predicted small lipoprotein YifL
MSPRPCGLAMVRAKSRTECVLARFRLVLMAVAMTGAYGLSGCGREGPLELPPGPAAGPLPTTQLRSPDGTPVPGSPEDTAVKTGFDAAGNPVASPGQKRSFILDPLLQ